MPDPNDMIAALDQIFANVRAHAERPIETPMATHRCCGDRPPISETAWLIHGRIIDITGRVYTDRGEPTQTTLPHFVRRLERSNP